ncbi:MAG TPA: LrgB family protein [Longimicrobium sp.]|nr:LrgB family protein [Longimicrobium sp.]
MGDAAAALLAIVATVLVYAAAPRVYARIRHPLLNPLLIAITTLIVLLEASGAGYERYDRGGRLISFWLGPAVVALGVPLHAQLHEIVRRGRAMLVSILAGSVVGIVSGTVTAIVLGAPRQVVLSVAARSVTTPIAMGVARELGGIPPLTAVLVISTGVLGAVAGPALMRLARIRSRTAWGLAMGSAAHGIGTARAVEEGEVEGATSGLAIGLMGLATAILAPPVVALLLRIFAAR